MDSVPAPEVEISAELVRGLLADQQPDLAELSLVEFASGWDNVLFRLGEDWIVRLPRRAVAAQLVLHEQRWLPSLAERLPLPVAAPVRFGAPGRGYPWSWSLCPWFEGEIAVRASFDSERVAREMGHFLCTLHHPAPADAPDNEVRGVPLVDRANAFESRITALAEVLDTPTLDTLRAHWANALAAPVYDGPPLWLHGDTHPANILIRNERIAAILDFGDITSGDPASDLATAWMLLPPESRPTFRAAAGGPDDATWIRARGWATHYATTFLATSADSPDMHQLAIKTVRNLRADPT